MGNKRKGIRLNALSLIAFRYEKARAKKSDYCVDDCAKCKNEDCLFGRKKQ